MNREISTIIHLQKNVIKNFGKQINTATDCEQLASLLKNDFNDHISAQTLRRFFGLIQSSSEPSMYTLNLLSKFCKFQNFEHFCQSYSNSQLENFFGAKEDGEKNYWRKSEELCRQIADSPELLVSTHHRLMSFPLVRKYFMENHPMRDMIGTVYSNYFLAYLKYNQNNEAKIFAYGFLFHTAFLLENTELLELYYKKVKETELTEDVFVIPAALKFGVILLYADFTNNEHLFRKTFKEMKNVRLRYIEASEKSVCSFESTVLESLIFTNRFKEMQFLIDNNTVQKNDDKSYVPIDRKQTHDEVFKILCVSAYHKMGITNNAKKFLDKINIANLGFGWEKYYSIMYYFVQLDYAKHQDKKEIITKLKTLINETYFCYYEEKLLKYTEENTDFQTKNLPFGGLKEFDIFYKTQF